MDRVALPDPATSGHGSVVVDDRRF